MGSGIYAFIWLFTLTKCDNYVITPSNVWNFFQQSNLAEPGKNQPLGSSSFFNQFWTYKHIYTHIYIYISAHTHARSLHDVSCANNNREAVVVCFSLAFYASGMRFFFENFRFNFFLNFVPLWWHNNSMMSQHISDLCWLPYFYHKDPYRIKFSRFYLLWGVRYKHLCDFSYFQKCDNYVITPSNVWIIFQDSNLSEPGQKYP